MRDAAQPSRWPGRLLMLVMAVFLLMPLVVLLGVSVNEQRTLVFPPQGFSLDWYAQIFTDASWRSALLASLSIAALSAALAVLIALPLAWFLWRWHAPWARFVQLLGVAPFMLPPVITALGFLSFWIAVGGYGQPWTVVISHAVFFTTLPLVTLSLGFASLDRSLVEAAHTLGARPGQVFLTVIWPLILPYAISGYAFAFVLSLNEYIVAFMTVGFTVETLPVKIFNALRYGYTPTMAAVSVVFMLIAMVIFGLIGRYGDLPKLFGALGGRGS